MKQIESKDNPLVKHLCLLSKNSEYRTSEGHVFVEGIHLIEEALKKVKPLTLLSDDEALLNRFPAEEKIVISKAVAEKLSSLESPSHLFALFPLPKESSLEGKRRLLVLDEVRDPGNLGTLFRTAEALGFGGVFLLPLCCDPFNPKALRASKGAPFKLPFRHGTIEELSLFVQKEGSIVLGADLSGEPPEVYEEELKSTGKSLALILGSEGTGLSPQAVKISRKVTIPMEGGMESLNVAIAGGILMYLLREYA